MESKQTNTLKKAERQLLKMLAQYNTYDEILVANKLFCIQGPWWSRSGASTLEYVVWAFDGPGYTGDRWLATIIDDNTVSSPQIGTRVAIYYLKTALRSLQCDD
jgi:hypothetical protein